jgi:hypothetical protein
MGDGRAVEGRQANPSVCLVTPLLTGSPKAFLTKNSFRVLAFLPGSALRVECDVTHSKQTIATFLSGARTPQFGSRALLRDGQSCAQISIAKPLSNRELELLEPRLTHRKQTIATRSNRELSTNPCFCNSALREPFTSHSLGLFTLTQEGPQEESVLPGFASRVEIAVTHSKQMVATFLPGSRIDTLARGILHAELHSDAHAAPQFANLGSRREPPIRNVRFTAASAFRYSAWTMLDLGYVREHLDTIEKMARDRGITLDLAPFREIDTERRQLITSAEKLKAERNRANEEIAGKKRAGEDASSILALMKEVSDRLKRDDARIAELDERLKQFLLTVPNIPHASVPVGKSAADNVEVRRWGAPPKFDFKPKPHWEIGEGAGILDFQAAVKIAGARFAVYKGLGARLERALANFFLDLFIRASTATPKSFRRSCREQRLRSPASASLPKFAADMFHLEGTDLWLTPTSEAELTSLHRDETLDAEKSAGSKSAPGRLASAPKPARREKTRAASSASINFKKWRCSNSRARNKVTTSWNRWSKNVEDHAAAARTALPRDAAVHRGHGIRFGENVRH